MINATKLAKKPRSRTDRENIESNRMDAPKLAKHACTVRRIEVDRDRAKLIAEKQDRETVLEARQCKQSIDQSTQLSGTLLLYWDAWDFMMMVDAPTPSELDDNNVRLLNDVGKALAKGFTRREIFS